MDSDLFILEKLLADRWGISPKTLQRWRSLGIGPAFCKFGKLVRYRLIDIEEFERGTVIKCDGEPFKGRPHDDMAEIHNVDATKSDGVYISAETLADRWRIITATLHRWRSLRIEPPFYRFGSVVGSALRYRLIEIKVFEKQLVIDREGKLFSGRPLVSTPGSPKITVPNDVVVPLGPRYATVQEALRALSSASLPSEFDC